jgi:amylosucrase
MASIWHTVATKDVRLLKHQMEQVFALPKEYTFLNYLRCHDDIGWGLDYGFLRWFGQEEVPHKKYLNDYLTGKWEGSFARGELYNDDPRLGDARLCGTTASLCGIEAAEQSRDKAALSDAIRRDTMLHALMFTMSGVPVLYSGDEIAQENDALYHNDPYKAEDSRYLHRGDLDWNKAALRHDAASVEGRIFEGLRTLERIRAELDAFDDQADVWLLETGNEHVLGIGRYFAGEQLLALFNFSDTQQQAYVDDPKSYDDALTGESRTAMTVTIPAGGFRWLIHQF